MSFSPSRHFHSGSKKGTLPTQQQTTDTIPRRFAILVRSILIDLPLAMTILLCCCTFLLRNVYHTYYVPLIERANRKDEDLWQEYTYYLRHCTEYDISTHNIRDLFIQNTLSNPVTQIMTHGALVIPQILSNHTARALRNYIAQRNQQVTDAETYPVSQGYRRLSYGIDATEHTAVSQALREIANHTLLESTLQAILGDYDPALAEITAITAYEGCPDQAWHQDTKADGNALPFARTYSHSYSLFLPLQDTTKAMGSTDICPGTHYCANDISPVCEESSIGLHQATNEGVFRAGDGALVNQHVWHRGSAHTDPNAPERIVFIVSFLARPNFGHDPRQLSRGTYFHQKWNMWGHTWQDLKDPQVYMKWPFSLLRSLHIWKPSSTHYGYDLATSVVLRFANNQLEDIDLEDRFLPRLERLGVPQFIMGQILPWEEFTQRQRWEHFLSDSLEKTWQFVVWSTIGIHLLYCLVLVGGTIILSLRYSNPRRRIRRSLVRSASRMMVTHGILLVLTSRVKQRIDSSEWALNILSGRSLQRPFPETSIAREDRTVSSGPTTIPLRYDVLFGTRYDARFLGAYDRWLDYHTGNQVFRNAIGRLGPSWPAYSSVNAHFAKHMLEEVRETIEEANGRFLQQDYRTGDWRILSEGESNARIQEELVAASNQFFGMIHDEIAHMIANYRFGRYRATSLARYAQILLFQFQKLVLPMAITTKRKMPSALLMNTWRVRESKVSPLRQSPVPFLHRSVFPSHEPTEYPIGATVWAQVTRHRYYEYVPATIEAYEGGKYWCSFASQSKTLLPEFMLSTYYPLTEGDLVLGCYDQYLSDCYEGTAVHVFPNGDASVDFDDGDFEPRMPFHSFYRPPYKYAPAQEFF